MLGSKTYTSLIISFILSIWWGEETRTHSIQNKCRQKSLSIPPITKNACIQHCSDAHLEETIIKDTELADTGLSTIHLFIISGAFIKR